LISRNLNIVLFATIGLITLSSCTKENFTSKEELLEFVTNPENGYLQEKQVNGIKYNLLYKPTDLLVAQELRDSFSMDDVSRLRKKYDPYLYFNLSMSLKNQELLTSLAGDRSKFGAMVNTLAFDMDRYVHLYTEKKDTIPLADFVYPRMYGMSKSTDLLFVYPNDELTKSQDLRLTIEDFGFYTGEIKFKLSKQVLNNTPQIIF
jgi:hypothetical protein